MAEDGVRGVLSSPIEVGDLAPRFELPALIGGVRAVFRWDDYRGKTLVFAFYPFNWQEASVRQMCAYQEQRARILARNAETVGVSVESIMNTTAWERARGPFDFPICSDFWPHGEVCARYGVLRTQGTGAGAGERATYVVGPDGRVLLREQFGFDEVPPSSDLLDFLESRK